MLSKIILHNYSLKTELLYCAHSYDTTCYPNKLLLVFKTTDEQYRCYSIDDLAKDNIKVEVVEAEAEVVEAIEDEVIEQPKTGEPVDATPKKQTSRKAKTE